VEIQGSGKVLGFVKDIRPHLTVRKTVFKPGDLLFTATDGLTEAESLNGRRFGKDGIQRSLEENRNAPAARIVQFMHQDLEAFVSGEINDDITLLVIKFR
jgi:serine phosphatase RsbU (regulator of sigma subunit)